MDIQLMPWMAAGYGLYKLYKWTVLYDENRSRQFDLHYYILNTKPSLYFIV